MKIIQFCILSLILAFNLSCHSFKKDQKQTGDYKEAIHNAILDFTNSAKLYKRHKVFEVGVYEIVGNNSLIVRIGRNNGKLLLTAAAKVGSKNSKLPSQYMETDGKLFFWWDEVYPLTKEALAVYEKYDLLEDDQGGKITVLDFSTNEDQKAVHYYFCPNNLTKYKKVTTNKGIGYYDSPKLKCTN